jgi:glycosyltransferase involved in cell wall biosynthesis
VAGALAESQMLILPSLSDGFGYVVLEALASGTVPVVSPEVGAAEVVRSLDPRLVVEREDFERTIPHLLDELDFEELGQQGRELAERFERRTMARALARKVLLAARDLPRPQPN